MEDLPHRHAVVAVGLEVLRHGGVVPRLDPPVGVEVVDPGGVGPAARQHGRATGSAHGLLREGRGWEEFREVGGGGSEGHLQTWGIQLAANSNKLSQTCAYAWRKTLPLDASWSMFGDLTVGSS